jgi:hypothetical protein
MQQKESRTFIFNIIFACLGYCVSAQVDTIPVSEQSGFSDLIEDYVQGIESEDFDFNTLFEDLEYFQRNPLDLNTAERSVLAELKILTPLQINGLLLYREKIGPLLTLYELQAVPGFDLATIKAILPFVTVGASGTNTGANLRRMLTKGRHQLYLRTGRVVERKKGYLLNQATQATPYLGDPWDHFVRYRYAYENALSVGFTAQKDAGEPFFQYPNRSGFDFYSAHFFIKPNHRWIKKIAFGDFRVSMGQGLLIHSGFAARKSALVMNIKRSGETFRPYTSLDENNFMRGAAITLSPSKYWEVSAFVSRKWRDANVQLDTLSDEDEEVFQFTSILNGGLHRTEREISNKNALLHTNIGLRLKYERRSGYLAFNFLIDHFGKAFQRNEEVYNQFYFAGKTLTGVSLDYGKVIRNFHIFGETARSDNGSIASVHGFLASLDRTLDVSVLHRFLPRHYQSIFPNVFAESVLANNEHGTYVGLEWKPDKSWRWSGYADFWKHPWLRYQVNAPSLGYEYFTRLTYTIKRKLELYGQFRTKTRSRNDSSDASVKNRPLVPHTRQQWRLQINHKTTRELEFRSRLEWSLYGIGEKTPTRGFMIYQDVLYKPIMSPLSIVGRLAYFDTEDFNSRIFAYENDVAYSFSVPVFYNQGFRGYVNLRYRGIRNMSWECRIARTWYTALDQIGSGLETIEGNSRTDFRLQCRIQF